MARKATKRRLSTRRITRRKKFDKLSRKKLYKNIHYKRHKLKGGRFFRGKAYEEEGTWKMRV